MAVPQLIVNADDLGLSPAVNAGIVAAHSRGVVTSASLMVRQGAAVAAADLVAALPRLAVGLHLDLGGWDYERGERLELGAAEEECRVQLERFRTLIGGDPTHLDSHKHAHESEPVAAVAARLATELGVPLRNRRIRYEGRFFGRAAGGGSDPAAVSPARLADLIRGLPTGWTEIGCHPAAGPVPASSYDSERRLELGTLCDPAVRAAIEEAGVHLRSFAQV
jgi:chitin disaccharide deacetylase